MKAGRIVIIALTFLIFPLFPSHGEGAVREAATVQEGGMSSGGVVRGDDIDAPGDSPYGKVLLAQASLATEEGAEKLSAPAKGGDNAPKGSGYGFFFNAFIIILREGFEAILVISALAAYLARSGNGEKVRTVYMGGGWALLASVVTAVTLSTVFTVGEEGKEAVEGVTMLLATAVLFYVSYWLITKSEVTRWQGYIKSKVERSISKGSVLALGFASFMAVYREGAETALFYLALFSTSDVSRGAVIAGFIAGSFVLVMIFLLFKYGEMRLPIGPFFAVTSTLLYYLAFVFSGKGVHALQEAGWISETHWDIVPKVKFIGLYPTVETIALQVALIGAMLIAVVYSLLIKPYREKLALGRDISHIGIDIDMLHDLLDDVNGHTTEIAKWARDSNVEEVQSHIRELDRKVHEVMGHLEALKRDTEDSFIETEKEISPQ